MARVEVDDRSAGQGGPTGSQTRLLVPALAPFYAVVSELSYPIIRITPSLIMLAMHGWGKLAAGAAPVDASMAKYGMYPPTVMAYVVMFLETVGAVCVALGFLTRIFAPALAIEMAVLAFYVHAPWGLAPNLTVFQLVLTWGLIFFAISLRGGGPYSLDRKIGWEL